MRMAFRQFRNRPDGEQFAHTDRVQAAFSITV